MATVGVVTTADLPHLPDGATVALVGVVGSTAYGLARPGSDIDRIGVYVAPTRVVLGLDGHHAVTSTATSTDPDAALHEVGKFTSLALKGNPTVVEALFCEGYEVLDDAGALLVEHRDAFLSTDAVRRSYTGYAIAQARRLQERTRDGKAGFDPDLAKRTAKHGRHCARLMLQARQLLTTGTLTLDVSAHRDDLFAMGEIAAADPERFAAEFERRLADLDAVTSVLPDHPDRVTVDRILVDIRLHHL